MKQCPICPNKFDAFEFSQHLANCNGATKRSTVDMKKCSLCRQDFPMTEFANHMANCTAGRVSSQIFKDTKRCITCGQDINSHEFANHLANCNGSTKRSTLGMKKCSICRQDFPMNEFANHMSNCTGRAHAQDLRETKKCITCDEDINSQEFVNHSTHCYKRNTASQSTMNPTNAKREFSIISNRSADHKNGLNDYQLNSVSHSSIVPQPNSHSGERYNLGFEGAPKKVCPLCKNTTDDLKQHFGRCPNKGSRNPVNGNSMGMDYSSRVPHNTSIDTSKYHSTEVDQTASTNLIQNRRVENEPEKVCPLCKLRIKLTQYQDHLLKCAERFESPPSDPHSVECPVCQKRIPQKDHEVHVNKCLDEQNSLVAQGTRSNSVQQHQRYHENSVTSKKSTVIPHKTDSPECFECSIIVGNAKNRSHVIPCRSRHEYCYRCIEKKVHQTIESKVPALCHSAFCDYELTRYDVWCLPLDAKLKDELIACVKNKARQQCPICQFYVECVEQDSFEKHCARCDVTNHEPCEKCLVPMNQNRLSDHRKTCDKRKSYERILSYVEFLEPRLKYSFSTHEIRYFIEYLRGHRLSTEAHHIVNSLAEFGEAFPFDIPKRTCDICADEFLFDDIFVFGCKDNHKTCYTCFNNSCESKMTQKQCLTCPSCEHQLADGEIKQLRVSSDKLEAYRNFQEIKLFELYSGRLIRCPRQGCKWAAEAMNPNEQFSVECRVCHHEFCSLCGQIPHPHASCREMPELTQRWFHWCNTERDKYWRDRAQQDVQFQEQVRQHEQQREATVQRNTELQQRYQELLADEQFKANNCRLCPTCTRVVQKLDGCDSMICGQNYHGGDVQSGCGNRFAWSGAAPYVAMAATGPNQIDFNLPEPSRDAPLIHRNIYCSSCQNELEGIRFDCIHCQSLIFCERCEQQSTLAHAEELEAENRTQHTFRLITTPENVDDD